MRVTHRMIADTVNYNLQRSLKRLDKYSNQLSTGKAFHRPSDNPVGVGRVMSYTAAVNRNEQFRLNMNQTKGWLENTEFALQNGLDVLQRVRELSIYGANESLTAEDRRAIAPEVLEFLDHFIGIANTETNGLYIFGGHQTLKTPFAREKIYHMGERLGGVNPDEPITASGLQNGTYTLSQSRQTHSADIPAKVIDGQSYLQGSSESIIGQAEWGAVNSTVNASVMIEVTGFNAESGEVKYRYVSHQYELDGFDSKVEDIFTLTFGDTTPKQITIGAAVINIEGLGDMRAAQAGGLRIGDRAVINITPAITAGNYDHVSLAGNHRDGIAEAKFIFNQGALDNDQFELKYFSLDSFRRSPDRGTVYDGSLKLTYDLFDTAEPALTFSYDSLGFPVYYGDNNDRIQEISPFQEMIMNVHGEKAFGDNQEVFEAVFDIYWALIENDREALGDTALQKADSAIEHFLGRLAEVGARSNRVEAMQNTLFSENLYLREVRSNIEDIDLAHVITEFTMQENAYRAALATASMMLQPTLVDYLR